MKEINNTSWHIGHVIIPGRIGLAPMAGFSLFRVYGNGECHGD